jgi:predicted membrane-bound spermidine synthase
LIPRIGFAGALVWGAAANLLCGAGAIMIGRQTAAAAGARHDEPDGPPVRPTAPTLPFPVWVAVFGLTGLIALGLEIAWFRLLGVLLKSTAFTFGTLLAVYLAGLGAGGAVGARVVHRTNRPGRTFLLLQFAMIWYAGLSVTALVIAIAGGYPARLVAYLGSYEPFDVSGAILSLTSVSLADPATIAQPLDFVLLYGAIPVLVVGPPTFLMGFSFPFLQRACQSDLHTLGRRVGTLLSANICGGVLGTALTGWILLPWLGTAAALKVLVALGLLLAWPLWRLAPAGRLVPAAAVALTLLAVTAMPNGPELWARLHASPPGTIIAAEDGSGLSVLKPSASGATTEVFINGLGQSEIPYGGIQTVLGALPALLHPAPQRIVIVGLGSGNTVFAAAARPETTRVTCVEIVGAQWTTLRAHDRAQPYAGLTRLLTDARIQPVTDDGRAYLLRSGPEFDIIEMDALRPTSAYAGNLNSREYFDLVGRRLRPGGLAVTWAPTRRSRDTFLSVFPHALRFTDILIGSHDPIPFDAGVLEGRALAARDYYLVAGIDILALVGPYLAAAPERVGPDTPRRLTDLNTDLFPRDEFSLP